MSGFGARLLTAGAEGIQVEAKPTKKLARVRIKVVCLECGHRWSVSPSASPQCSDCNSVDVEIA